MNLCIKKTVAKERMLKFNRIQKIFCRVFGCRNIFHATLYNLNKENSFQMHIHKEIRISQKILVACLTPVCIIRYRMLSNLIIIPV